MASRTGKPNKGRGLLFATLACSLAGGGLWYSWSHSDVVQAAAKLPAELAAARQAGMPTTPDELRAQIRQKTGTNGAHDYLDAFARAKSLRKNRIDPDRLEKLLRDQGTAAEVASAKAEVKRNASALASFELGSQKDLLDYNRPWEQGLMVLYPDLGDARNLALLECLRAYYNPAERNSLLAVARTSKLMENDRSMVSAFFRGWIEKGTIDTLLALMQKEPENARLRALARETLKEMGPLPDARKCFGGELVVFRVGAQQLGPKQIEELKMAGVNVSIHPQAVAMLRFPVVRQANEATMVRFWREMAAAVPKDPEDILAFRAGVRAVESRYTDRERIDHSVLVAAGMFRVEFPDNLGTILTRRRLLAATVDALDYRATTGSLPKTLAVADPFGKQMVYKPSADGFKLYSVGPDGNDDGGRERDKNGGVRYDVGYELRLK